MNQVSAFKLEKGVDFTMQKLCTPDSLLGHFSKQVSASLNPSDT